MLVPSRSLTGVPPSSVPVAWETLLLRGGIRMGLGWECEMVRMGNSEEEQLEEQASDVFVNSVLSTSSYCHVRILR